ncbi:putative rhamnogalacturonan endolyase [Medicago truncatula]|uniref:rhamnogalacturonan endolyase n=1 Tax=Medicago truncatula TaxID=3880 RepID=A0A396GK90_MEDTR|nr:rhamnogalacturonate lyase-like isoform X2 [Medicago truncatula]RHN41536.1 putative rhamnogalacturonan endolyase [Medicago truncatula]
MMKMKVLSKKNKHVILYWWFGMIVQFCFLLCVCAEKTSLRGGINSLKSKSIVKLNTQDKHKLVVDNGIVSVSMARPEGYILGISYNGIDNVLDSENQELDRGYFDVVWNEPGEQNLSKSTFQRIHGTNFSVIAADENMVEVSFSRLWTHSMSGKNVPINIDIRYIFRSGDSGFYSYAIFNRPKGMPGIEVDQIRFVFKLDKDRFKYMAISDTRQRNMPAMKDRNTGQVLAYPEAVLLTNPINPQFRGEVDDKYQYSCENKDNTVHGWIGFDSDPPVGFWMITPSNEFRNGGPIKQDLTSHVGPIALSMFVSTHYAGKEVTMAFQEGETYKKVFGPVFVYLNTASSENDNATLWSDAVQQLSKEVQSWPYDFPQSQDYFPPNQRGAVFGRLLVQDWYFEGGRYQYANNAYVGLALPGDAGSWQRESKGYQFWTQTDAKGYFKITNVVPGHYNLFGWVSGFIGDYKYNSTITITPGGVIKLNSLVYNPPRNGPTIWEIGIPDRLTSEFHVPEPYPTLMNKLYTEGRDNFRQYGLWERYTEMYPTDDLIYTLGVNKNKDWFYAHVTRNTENNTYEPTTWQIIFEHQHDLKSGNYTLQLALASAADAYLQVRFNDRSVYPPHFATGHIGRIRGDNCIQRHGIHGLYRLFSIDVPSNLLLKGKNIIYLTQTNADTPFQGVMYDYIRLEQPPAT